MSWSRFGLKVRKKRDRWKPAGPDRRGNGTVRVEAGPGGIRK